MGEKYNAWMSEVASEQLLTAYHLDNLSLEQANALEALVDPTLKTCKEYKIQKKDANVMIAGLLDKKVESIRPIIEDIRDRTIYRHNG